MIIFFRLCFGLSHNAYRELVLRDAPANSCETEYGFPRLVRNCKLVVQRNKSSFIQKTHSSCVFVSVCCFPCVLSGNFLLEVI